jgi:Arc/MetJ-type ribon-helix-helix transcriptional regulator
MLRMLSLSRSSFHPTHEYFINAQGLTLIHTPGNTSCMGAAKIAISLSPKLLRRVDTLVKSHAFPSRSAAIQIAVAEKISRLDRTRLARECARLSPVQEQQMADEGLAADFVEWPQY